MSADVANSPAAAQAAEPAPGAPRRRLARADLVLIAFLGALATLLQLLREPGIPSWNTMWQEDGSVFMTEALNRSFVRTLVTPYNAYLHVIARIVAYPVSLFPLRDAALLLSVASAIVVTLVAAYVYVASADVLRTQWARALIAISVVLLPASGYETVANVTNLHWYLTFGCFWALLHRPRTTAGVAVAAVVTALAVLSDPLTGILLPVVALAAWRAYQGGGRRGWVVPAVFVVAMVIQLVLGAVSDPVGRYASSHFTDIPTIYALRVAASFLVGDLFLDDFWIPYGAAFAWATVAVLVAFFAWALIRMSPRRRLFVGLALLTSVLFLAIPLQLRGTENFLDRTGFNLNGSRYALLPLLFLTTAVVAALDRRDPRLSPGAWRNAQIGVAAAILALIAINFSDFNVRTVGPRWSDAVTAARAQCAATGGRRPSDPPGPPNRLSRKGIPAGYVRIPIAPNIPEQPFAVTVSCSHLR